MGNDKADDTFYLGNFIAGYDTTTDQELKSNLFNSNLTAGKHVVIVYDATEDDALYVMVLADHIS